MYDFGGGGDTPSTAVEVSRVSMVFASWKRVVLMRVSDYPYRVYSFRT